MTPKSKIEIQRIDTAVVDYYKKYDIDPGKSLIYSIYAFENSHPPQYQGTHNDVSNYQKLLQEVQNTPGANFVKDLNAEDENNAHKKYIFAVTPNSITDDIFLTNSILNVAKKYGFRVKEIAPHSITAHTPVTC